jgi:archaellum component FlaC
MVSLALAQDDSDNAPAEETQVMQQMAKDGFLGDKKDFYLSAKTLAEDDVTDGLLKINDLFSQLDLKSLKPGILDYPLEDLKALLKLVEVKEDDIKARKVSAWKFENRLQKMIAALTPPSGETPMASPEASSPSPTGIPTPRPTSTPVWGPDHADWDDMKTNLKDMVKKTDDLKAAYDKKLDEVQKSNDDLKTSGADTQEQLKLMKKLLDRVQDDLTKTSEHLDEVQKKASAKTMTDTELQQELTIMHKDLRDNSQDVAVLKEEMTKVSKQDAKDGQSPLDDVLSSKWLAGGALAVGLTALIISLTRK